MKTLLELHRQHGPRWHAPGFHSGYNEVILNSAQLNAALPASISAFFVVKGASPVTSDLGYSIIIDAVRDHRAFLDTYRLTSDEVPLLSFDPANWHEPFSIYRG